MPEHDGSSDHGRQPDGPPHNAAKLSDKELLTYLQNMYKEQCDQARQHETLRHQSTS